MCIYICRILSIFIILLVIWFILYIEIVDCGILKVRGKDSFLFFFVF